MLWNPAQRPQLLVCFMPNPDKTPNPRQPLLKHSSKSSCLSLRQLGQPDEPWTECRSCTQALSPLGYLGLTTPTQRSEHPSLYQHFGSKPDLSPHNNPDSVPHIVIVLCC